MAADSYMGTRAQRAFIITISIQAIVVLVMVAITFRFVEDHVDFNQTSFKTIPCYLALFALAEIFQLLMAFDALRLRNIIQLVGILMFQGGLIVFAALQVHETHSALVNAPDCDSNFQYVGCGGPGTLWKKVEPFLIVVPCIIAASWLVMLFWVGQLYGEFGWAIFHVVGANPKMKTMYQWYQIMICLLKFDFFCFTGVTMQLLILVLARNSAEFGVTVAAIPVVLILLAACGLAVQREFKWLMTVSLVLMLAAMSYLYKLVRFYQPSSRNEYMTTRATLTTFTIGAFLLLFATFIVGLRCFSDFGRGLQASKVNAVARKPRYSNNPTSPEKGARQTSYNGGSTLGNRISIE